MKNREYKDRPSFVVCDENNHVATLCGVKMFGRKVNMPAIFFNEDDALFIACEIESKSGIKHKVDKVSPEMEGSFYD